MQLLSNRTEQPAAPHPGGRGPHAEFGPQKSGLLPHRSNGTHPGDWANAGVRTLVRIGADHATAAPAPIRLSAFLRGTLSNEAPTSGWSGAIRDPSLPPTEGRSHGSACCCSGEGYIIPVT